MRTDNRINELRNGSDFPPPRSARRIDTPESLGCSRGVSPFGTHDRFSPLDGEVQKALFGNLRLYKTHEPRKEKATSFGRLWSKISDQRNIVSRITTQPILGDQ